MFILLHRCTTCTLTKRIEKKLDSNWTRMLQAILNKSWKQHPTKQHPPAISKTIQIKWTIHIGQCWRSGDKLISGVLLWTPSHGQTGAGRPARTNLQQLCMDTGCSQEGLSNAMDDRNEWRGRISEIRAHGRTWWWWYVLHSKNYIYIYIYIYISPWHSGQHVGLLHPLSG